jgi:hypothetical protein
MLNKATALYRDFKYQTYRTRSTSENFNFSLFLRAWVSDRLFKLSPMKASLPWMPYSTILKLHSVIRKDFNILETGCGGSSLFFLQRCKTLTSLEHDKKWILELENRISVPNYKNRWSLVLRDLTTEAFNKSPYLDFIKNQKEETFDLISIDGRLRSESLKIASSKVKRGGFILLDNSERHQYQKSVAFLNELGWNRKDYEGICYGLEFDSKSTIWQRK